MNTFRNYSNSHHQYQIEQTYRKCIQKQTLQYVLEMKAFYMKYPNIKHTIWEVFQLLENIYDHSDPDTNDSQMVHAYQTAKAIRYKYLDCYNKQQLKKNIRIQDLFSKEEWEYLPNSIKDIYKTYLHDQYESIKEWDWFPLVGFLHDLGKVLLLNDFGRVPQWSVVGDTFPVGCRFSNKNIFYDHKFHRKNKDYGKYTSLGIYKKHCGFDKLHMSYGHDEYLASILKINKTKLPKEAIYIIRFHSFYAWHNPKNSPVRGYTSFASDYDWKMLPLLKAFQKADLYSKKDGKKYMMIKEIFTPLVTKYIGKDRLLIW